MKDIYHYCQISRQTHFKSLKRLQNQDDILPFVEGLILELRQVHPGMSLRKIYEKTQPEGIGRDAFIKLGLELGYRLRSASNKARTTFSIKTNKYPNLLKGKRFTDVNQIWTSDITYFRLQEVFLYISLIMDVYSRRIIGYQLAQDLRAIHCIEALKMAFKTRDIKSYQNQLIHHSDKGSQYLSKQYINALLKRDIEISTCDSVYENTHIERLNGTIKNQYLKRWNISDLTTMKKKIKAAVEAYNIQRPHDSLKGKSPIEFEEYIKELPINSRPKLEIFTFNDQKHNYINPMQLILNL